MAISSNLQVTADVDGEYTLSELLDLLGSPKKFKDTLGELEKATKAHTKALKDLNAAEAKRKADLQKDFIQRTQDLEEIAKGNAALAAGNQKLLDDTARVNAELNQARNGVREKEAIVAATQISLDRAQDEIKAERRGIIAERSKFMAQSVAVQERAKQDRTAAETAREEAKTTLAEANAKIADMRKVLG